MQGVACIHCGYRRDVHEPPKDWRRSGNGTLVALQTDYKDKVDAVYKLALELGGTDEGKPGPRGDGF